MNISKMIDASCDTTTNVNAMKDAGVTHIGRYYNHENSTLLPTKCLTPNEAQILSEAGFRLVVVYQQDQNSSTCFSMKEGRKAAKQALLCAYSVGQPLGSTIYFAVDYDASEKDVKGVISDYFKNVNGVLAGKYLVGAYGSGLVCNTLYKANLCEFRWLSESTGYSGTESAIKQQDYEIRQQNSVKSDDIGTLQVDYDVLSDNNPEIGAFNIIDTFEVSVSQGSHLHVRQAPCPSSRIVDSLSSGAKVTKADDGWTYVKTLDGIEGFVSSQYIVQVD